MSEIRAVDCILASMLMQILSNVEDNAAVRGLCFLLAITFLVMAIVLRGREGKR